MTVVYTHNTPLSSLRLSFIKKKDWIEKGTVSTITQKKCLYLGRFFVKSLPVLLMNFFFLYRTAFCFARKYGTMVMVATRQNKATKFGTDNKINSSVMPALKATPPTNTRFQRLSLFHRSFINFFISKSSALIGLIYINCTRNSHKSQKNN